MAYKIQYSPETAKRYPQVKSRNRGKLGKWVLIGFLLIAILWMRVKGVPDYLIPGDPEVTRSAAAMMVENLQSGTAVNEAVSTFCKTIMHGAGL